jgi:ubiquinone/menaquinone biosynthesis C-methylase UbiE
MSTNSTQTNEQNSDSKSTSGINLNTRLSLNAKYQSRDFHAWHHRVLDVQRGEHVLDVGCGTGAQSLRFLDEVQEGGSVTALDISDESISDLLSKAGEDARLQAVVSDMDNLSSLLESTCTRNKFTLANSSYAIYYSNKWRDVLRVMADSLISSGRIAIFTPTTPHGMVDIASRFARVPTTVYEGLTFGETELLPEVRSLFWDVEAHYFQSEMIVKSADDFVSFYEATSYFDPSAQQSIKDFAFEQVTINGNITYPKNGLLVIGRERKP